MKFGSTKMARQSCPIEFLYHILRMHELFVLIPVKGDIKKKACVRGGCSICSTVPTIIIN